MILNSYQLECKDCLETWANERHNNILEAQLSEDSQSQIKIVYNIHLS